jgi:hypothetical protein
MSLAAEFTPIALIFLVISFLMPDTSRLLFEAIHRKFKKPIMLDAATVSISSEKSVVVEKAKKFGFVTKYTLMPNNSLRIVLQLPEDCDAFLQMLE